MTQVVRVRLPPRAQSIITSKTDIILSVSAEHRVKHRFFKTADFLLDIAGSTSWFNRYGLSAPRLAVTHPDLRVAKMVTASMLIEAWDRDAFYKRNSDMLPLPDEFDRILYINWLQAIASTTGLLNGEEINLIQECEGKINPIVFYNGTEVNLTSLEQLKDKTKRWKIQGKTIGGYIGAFDPPTVTHLGCATDAYTQCDHLIIGFDSNEALKRRKGPDRPRYDLQTRRKIFNGFWMIDDTFVLNATDINDPQSFSDYFKALNIDYVFINPNQEDMTNRLRQIELAGAQPRYFKYQGGDFSSTFVMSKVQKWGFINMNLK